MNWIFKAVVQQVFSYLPFGEKLNYFGQKYVVRGLPLNNDEFLHKVSFALKNFNAYSRYAGNSGPVDRAVFFEFGTGWDLIIPLAHYLFGINSQIIIDNRAIARYELINDSLKKFKELSRDLPPLVSGRLDKVAGMYPVCSMQRLNERLGIVYRAPCDARATGLESGSIDFISSTATLEHIPANEIPLIFSECYRVLKTGGIMASTIDYVDHYSYFDKSISAYNFLKYPETTWQIYNPGIQYQNRLRHKDFLLAAGSAGFAIVEDDHYMPAVEDIKLIETMKLNNDFRSKYQSGELAIKNGFIVLRKD
jgi:SAM-dependent methyltransferase